MPAKVAIWNAAQDEKHAQQLIAQLKPLVQSGLLAEPWSESQIPPGADRQREIERHIGEADVVLVLVSVDLLADENCMRLVASAIRKAIPVLLRSCLWKASLLGPLQPLPTTGVPISAWSDRDAAWLDVVVGLSAALATATRPPPPAYKPDSGTIHPPGAYSRQTPVPTAADAPQDEILFSWLHLSDLHFGHPNVGHGMDQLLVLKQLEADIVAGRGGLFPAPDALLVTGDIAFSGAAAQYEKAAAFLRGLSVPDRRVFPVPGNHDVNRAADRDKSTGRLIRGLRQGTEELDAALADAGDSGLLRSRQEAYLAFASTFGPGASDALCWSCPVEGRGGLRLRFVGLNSALLAADDSDKGCLRLGTGQLALGLGGAQRGEIVIVLSHHPFQDGWLADQKDADGWVRNHAHMHLFGHVHEADAQATHSGPSGAFVRVVAGAAHGDRGESSHGYNCAAIVRRRDGLLRLRLWPRRFSLRRRCFAADSDLLLDGQLFVDYDLRQPRI